jgi:2-polyprenyl-3-methyl-5-hydroxy-6-metoxy-1,4-benzoquinol methylase
MVNESELSRCCGDPLTEWLRTDRIVITRCERCGTLWGNVTTTASGKQPWADLEVSNEFAEALQQRRITQAKVIIQRFPEVRKGKVLDYGTGQGVFLRELRAEGVDAWGADLDIEAPRSVAPTDRLIKVDAPWEVPTGDWDTVCMLDVLEHHSDPEAFVASLPGTSLLIKVPKATGPLTRLSRVLAKLGRASVLEGIFLVDDVSSHEVLFTKKGLVTMLQRAGWSYVRSLEIADVGRELPERIRIDSAATSSLVKPVARAVGFMVESVAPAWSETEVFLFTRAAGTTK